MLIDMPMMRSSHAQLLVGAGYRTVEAIAKAEPSLLCADVLHYALSPEGQRLIREGRAPDMEQLLDLAQQAREVKAA